MAVAPRDKAFNPATTPKILAEGGTPTNAVIAPAGSGDTTPSRFTWQKVKDAGKKVYDWHVRLYDVIQGSWHPATTPQRQMGMSGEFTDAYRSGMALSPTGSASGDDNLDSPRVLGQDPDQIASISITTAVDSDSLAKFASGDITGDIVSTYSRFFLQSVTEPQQEKFQIVETFTAFYAFFYGKRPSVYTYQGMLINDPNHRWSNDLLFYYNNYFRGTKAAQLGAQAVISYDGRVVSGYILNLSLQQNSDLEKGVGFSMNLLVTDHVLVKFSADMGTLLENARNDIQKKTGELAQLVSQLNRSSVGSLKTAISQVASGVSPAAGQQGPEGVAKPQSSKKKGISLP